MASVQTNVLKLNCDWRPRSTQNVLKQTHGFIWKGNDKIKRSALINGVENGEPRMLDIESMISAQRVMALKKYFGDGNSSWKNILDEFLCNVGRKFILFVTSTLVNSRYIAAFSKQCLDAWRSWRIQMLFLMRMLLIKSFGITKILLLTIAFQETSVFSGNC